MSQLPPPPPTPTATESNTIESINKNKRSALATTIATATNSNDNENRDVWTFTAIDNDYGPPLVDMVVSHDFDKGLAKLKTAIEEFYKLQIAAQKKYPKATQIQMPVFDWEAIDDKLNQCDCYDAYYKSEDDSFYVFAKLVALD